MNTMKLKINSSTERLHKVREFVSDAARKFGFEDESISKIALAVDEACTNIIKHAYGYSPDQEIEITIRTKNSEFEIVISDNGKSFDPSTVKLPDLRDYRTKYRKGGLGMYLIYSLMDEVNYNRSRDNRNEVHLVKHLRYKLTGNNN